MGEFEDRIKQAAQRYSQANTANDDASIAMRKNRADFLVAFEQVAREPIRAVLVAAQESLRAGLDADLPAESRLRVEIDEPIDQKRLALRLLRGGQTYRISFDADPVAMRVKVTVDTRDGRRGILTNEMPVERIEEASLKHIVGECIADWLRY